MKCGRRERAKLRRARAAALLVAGLVLVPSRTHAQALEPEDVPAPLRPWVSWVLHDEATYGCTYVDGSQRCIWPGTLSLEVDGEGGDFELDVVADRETRVSLPGDRAHFPHDVRVDGTPREVLERPRDGSGTDDAVRPYVRVAAGSHTIEGELRWERVPELLPLPAAIARVALTIDGTRVTSPERNEQGALQLRQREASTREEGHVELEIHRRLQDGVPFRVATRVTVRASGMPREVDLGRPLLSGTAPGSIEADIPSRLTNDEHLMAQVQAGTHVITIRARAARPPEALSPPEQPAPWPRQEAWVWVADEDLRQVEVRGAPTVDARRANVPSAWREHPAYAMNPERTLRFETTRRGTPEPGPNGLRLQRSLWLDLDGHGWTVRDRLRGTLRQGYRLDLQHGTLGRVRVDGGPRLITTHDGTRGVEVRTSELQMRAISRLPDTRGAIPAVGWSEDMQQLDATVQLPPGWSLLAVRGADSAPGTWLAQWTLWGLFFVLLVTLALGRLLGPLWGGVALVTLPLLYHEPGAPVTSWVAIVVLMALSRVLPEGRLARLARLLFWATLIVVLAFAVPFAARQLRFAWAPQTVEHEPSMPVQSVPWTLETDESAPEVASEAREAKRRRAGRPDAVPQRAGAAAKMTAHATRKKGPPSPSQARDADRAPAKRPPGWIDPTAEIQTGPGTPDWHRRTWSLDWSGPVTQTHRVELWLLAPWATRSLSVVRVLLLAALIFGVLRFRPRAGPRTTPTSSGSDDASEQEPPPEDEPSSHKTSSSDDALPSSKDAPAESSHTRRMRADVIAGAIATTLATLLAAGSAHAQGAPSSSQPGFPSDVRLEQLRQRLTRAPACVPECVLASEMQLTVRDTRLILDVIVHAGTKTAWKLPGPVSRWVPDEVRVDGRETHALAARNDGFVYARLQQGRHDVHLEGSIAGRDMLTLELGDPPRSIEVDADGWTVEGIRKDGRVSSSIRLQRVRTEPTKEERDGESRRHLPDWLVVHRTLTLGVRWTVDTKVERVTPTGSPVVARIPLLDREDVTTSGVLVEDGEVVVSLGRKERTASWSSVLPPRDALMLRAPEGVRRSSRWTLKCSPIWRCRHEGVAPVHRLGEAKRWAPTFHPWPGESVSVQVSRPAPAPGRTTTVERATLELTPGRRLQRAELDLDVRSSSGTTQMLTLPPGARVQSLEVGGEDRAVQRDGDALRVTLSPGRQDVDVRWQQPTGMSAWMTAPEVDLGREATNARVRVDMPSDRWVVWTRGPPWGATVLFWPYLALVIGIAVALARTRLTPLGFGQWALLGLGLTQIPAWAALLVVGWFFALAHRRRHADTSPGWFDLRQLGLILYTIVALACLYAAVHAGLLLQPDMELAGSEGATGLGWYTDRIEGALPQPAVLSLPIWTWRVVMLAWALWLAWRLVRWAPWWWDCMREGGLWRRRPKRKTTSSHAP